MYENKTKSLTVHIVLKKCCSATFVELWMTSKKTFWYFASCRNYKFKRIGFHWSDRNGRRSRQCESFSVRHASCHSRLFSLVRFNRFSRKRSNDFLPGPRQPHRHLHWLSATPVDKFARFLLRSRIQSSCRYGGDASQATAGTFKNSCFFLCVVA